MSEETKVKAPEQPAPAAPTKSRSTNEEVAAVASSILKKLAPFSSEKQMAVMRFVGSLITADVAEEIGVDVGDVVYTHE